MGAKDQATSLRYACWNDRFEEEKPFIIVSHMPWLEDEKRTNIVFKDCPEEVISDIRGRETDFSLDQNGFEVHPYDFSCFDPTSIPSIETVFMPEAEKFLMAHVIGAEKVHFFDYRLRIAAEPEDKFFDITNGTHPLLPVTVVHVDQSPEGVRKRIVASMGDEAASLAEGRVRLINIWFPLEYSVEDDPLAICDGSTVERNDMLVADWVSRTYVGETTYPLYTGRAKWYYMSEQKPSEVLLMKIFDSDETIPARFTPHVSFSLNGAPEGARPRKSFEIRALVFGGVTCHGHP